MQRNSATYTQMAKWHEGSFLAKHAPLACAALCYSARLPPPPSMLSATVKVLPSTSPASHQMLNLYLHPLPLCLWNVGVYLLESCQHNPKDMGCFSLPKLYFNHVLESVTSQNIDSLNSDTSVFMERNKYVKTEGKFMWMKSFHFLFIHISLEACIDD